MPVSRQFQSEQKNLFVHLVPGPHATSPQLGVAPHVLYALMVLGHDWVEFVSLHVSPSVDHLLHSSLHGSDLVALIRQPVEVEGLLVHLPVVAPQVARDEASDGVTLVFFVLGIITLRDGFEGGRSNEDVAIRGGSNAGD